MRGILAVLALLVVAVIAYYVYDLLRVRSAYELEAEIIHIEDTRVLSDDLIDFLKDPSPVVRARAALAVGRIGGEKTGPLLFDLVGDSSTDVASSAAFALGLTGQKKYAAEILDYAFDLPSAVGASAVEAAGRLADSSMTDVASALTGYLSHPSPDVRAAACRALFLANAKAQARAMIELLDDEPDDEVRSEAIYALARMEVPGAADIFEEAVADPDPFVRSWALRGLSRTHAPKAEHYLSIAMNDADRQVVAQCIAELARSTTDAAERILVRRLETEKDEKHLVSLLNAVRRQGNQSAIARATELVQTNASENVVGAAAKYLAAVTGDRAVTLIDSLMLAADARLKIYGAEAYGLTKQKKVVPRLATLFSDEDPAVRAAAYAQVVALDSGNVSFYIDKALNDPDPVLEAMAVGEIEQRKLSTYAHTMATMMSRGEDIDTEIRRSLVSAAGTLLATKSENDSLYLSVIVDGLIDKNYIIRRESADQYKKITGKDRYDRVAPAATRISEGEIADALETFARTKVNPQAKVVTKHGEFTIELFINEAPLTVINFMKLVKSKFYDGLTFHRVIPNFVAQGGDPRGDGWGGPDYYIRDEYTPLPYDRGSLGIATSGKDTGGSQFFIALSAQPHLEARYTVFGQVISGMDAVDLIAWGDIITSITIEEGR